MLLGASRDDGIALLAFAPLVVLCFKPVVAHASPLELNMLSTIASPMILFISSYS